MPLYILKIGSLTERKNNINNNSHKIFENKP